MIYDKKGVTAQRAKDKLSVIQSYFDKIKMGDEEKDVIIDYLLDCLVNNEVFEYSTLGPNIYKNEHSISNVSDTQL